MRTIYKEPKELATCLKDLVELYEDDLMSFDKLKDKITRIVEANEDRYYKEGRVKAKIAQIIGEDNLKVIDSILVSK